MENKIELIETAEQPVLSVRKVTSVTNLPQEIGSAYHIIMAYLGELGEQPVDVPFTAYYNMDMENLEVEMGFPVSKKIAGRGEVISNVIPAGKKVTCLYKGPYKDMIPTYEALNKFIADNGYKPVGIVYEHYYNSPMEVPESDLLTKIVFLVS
ncbi:MAG TPA: GyrI-like domain-containing protein [Desulfitobacteriaceae bacterium]|nr:GyrI-like domain-containing protein [Desulfitobacteriaceae bacterium]